MEKGERRTGVQGQAKGGDLFVGTGFTADTTQCVCFALSFITGFIDSLLLVV